MTLIDSRAGIGVVYRRIAEETGVRIDVDLVTSRLGPPLEDELANWFPVSRVAGVADRYRALYRDIAIGSTLALPGARESLAAVHALGGHTMVVTAKVEANARLHLDTLGLEVDLLVGSLWSGAKGNALRDAGARAFVGDHTADIVGARAGGAMSNAVASGPFRADELAAAVAARALADPASGGIRGPRHIAVQGWVVGSGSTGAGSAGSGSKRSRRSTTSRATSPSGRSWA
jgi:phosphoglycolate phosphatase